MNGIKVLLVFHKMTARNLRMLIYCHKGRMINSCPLLVVDSVYRILIKKLKSCSFSWSFPEQNLHLSKQQSGEGGLQVILAKQWYDKRGLSSEEVSSHSRTPRSISFTFWCIVYHQLQRKQCLGRSSANLENPTLGTFLQRAHTTPSDCTISVFFGLVFGHPQIL